MSGVGDTVTWLRSPPATWYPVTSCCWRSATTYRRTGRIFESVHLKIQEAALTGESNPVQKQTDRLTSDNVPLGDRTNMVYMGTWSRTVTVEAVVTETGMDTELGQIAHSLQTVQYRVDSASKTSCTIGACLGVVGPCDCGDCVLVGMVRGENTRLMLMTALSLAVAVVPEGLPAVATVALAPRGASHVPAAGPDSKAPRSRDAGIGHGHLFRQDGHLDRKPHGSDGRGGGGGSDGMARARSTRRRQAIRARLKKAWASETRPGSGAASGGGGTLQ